MDRIRRRMQKICAGKAISAQSGENKFYDCDIFHPWELDTKITKSSIIVEDGQPSYMFVRAPVDDYNIDPPEVCVETSTRTKRRSGGKPLFHYRCDFDSDVSEGEALEAFEDVTSQVRR